VPNPPSWLAGSDGGGQEPPRPRTAKARRKRDPRELVRTGSGEYGGGPAGDKKCGANKKDGGTCSQAAGHGTDHPGYGPCSYHKGTTPAGRKSSAHEMAEELSMFYGHPIETTPIQALLEEVSRTAGHVKWLADTIATFDVPLVEEADPSSNGIVVRRPAGLPPEVESWIRVYQSERNQLIRASKACLDAGVNERLVQIAEAQAAKFANAIDTILDALGLTPQQRELVPHVVPQVLRGLAASPAILEGVIEP
jgi:hypothetical protein